MDVLLFSGGIDSTCLAWGLKPDRLAFFDYGQIQAKGEIRAGKNIAQQIGIPLDVHEVPLQMLGSGTMAGKAVDEARPAEFWPYRNQALITLAAMAYFAQGVSTISIGTVAGDDRHPDGSGDFVNAISRLVSLQSGPTVKAPAMGMSSEQLIEKFNVPQNLLGWTFSCHTGVWACGQCNGCKKQGEIIAWMKSVRKLND